MRPCHPTETLQKRQCSCGLFWLACPCSSDVLCPACIDDWAYYQAHREQETAYSRKKRNSYQRSWRQSHREQYLNYQNAYYQTHKKTKRAA